MCVYGASTARSEFAFFSKNTPQLTRIYRCAPRYLSQKSHSKLAKQGTFDSLRIHTDEIMEVISRITPSTLTIAIVRLALLRSPALPY
jgi:hypothetical protein